jgi:hypothetical protein
MSVNRVCALCRVHFEPRDSVQVALPDAPAAEQQTVRSPAIWYTTLGRLLEEPHTSAATVLQGLTGQQALAVAAQRMSDELCGLETTVSTLWYVLEHDLMALALNGAWTKRDAPMTAVCPQG